jgi:hypothetical protein
MSAARKNVASVVKIQNKGITRILICFGHLHEEEKEEKTAVVVNQM